MLRLVTSFVFLLGFFALFAGAAHSQTNNGNCNVNLTNSSGNTTNVYCGNGAAPQETSVKLVVGTAARQTIFGFVNTQNLDCFGSAMLVEIDGDSVISGTPCESINDEFFERKSGEYFYTITLRLLYLNGLSVSTSCKGIIKLFTSAEIIPFIEIGQDFTSGRITAGRCGFNLR